MVLRKWPADDGRRAASAGRADGVVYPILPPSRFSILRRLARRRVGPVFEAPRGGGTCLPRVGLAPLDPPYKKGQSASATFAELIVYRKFSGSVALSCSLPTTLMRPRV